MFQENKCSPLFEIRETPKTRNVDQTTFDMNVYHDLQPLDREAHRATQYSLQDFSIPNREKRPPHTFLYNGTGTYPSYLDSRSSQGLDTTQQDRPYQTVGAFDTEMSDLASGGHQSTGFTPSNSQPPSSTTSHSSPSDTNQNNAYETTALKTAGPVGNLPFLRFPPQNTNQLTPPSESEITTTPVEAQHDQHPDNGSFTIPARWHLENTGGTPSATAGMTPLGEGGWAQMLEGMGWDGGALGSEGLAWAATTESTT